MKSNKETYEDIIVSLIESVQEQEKKEEELLIEGCKEMYEDMLKMGKLPRAEAPQRLRHRGVQQHPLKNQQFFSA